LLEDSLQFGLSEYGQLFNRDGIEKLKARHLNREINVGYHLWGLLILFLWMKKWQVQLPGCLI
jgi:asparagine synthase (glutamine-hydrolysing)